MCWAMFGAALVIGLAALIAAAGLGPLARQPPRERWMLASIGAVVALAVVSLLFARVGVFSIWTSSAALLLAAAAIRVFSRKRPAFEAVADPSPGIAGYAAYVPGVLIALFGLYAVFPTYFFLGGQDPGVYLVFAARIATTGALDLDLPWMRELWASHRQGIAIGYPGVYSLLQSDVGDDPTRLSPQFMHLFPALAANAWAAGGPEATVRVNAVLATLTLWVGFAYVRRLVNEPAAIAFVLVLGLNPAFIWGARITLTEVLAALLVVTGLYLLLLTREDGKRHWAIAAGAVLGLGVLNRLDAAFSGIPVLGFALATIVERRLASAARAAAIAYLVTSGLGFLDGRLFAPFYFQTLLGKHHLAALIGISTVSGAAALAITYLPDNLIQRFKLDGRLLHRAGGEVLRILILWILIALFAWPLVDARSDARAARELGWYLTPLAWPLALLGFGLALGRREWSRWLPILTFASAVLIAYTLGPGVVPEHIWASRRWLSHVIPLFAVLGTFGASACVAWARRHSLFPFTLGALLAVGYLGAALGLARPFLFRSMLEGLPDAYASLATRIARSGAKPPFMTGSHHIASILTYLYDVPTVLFGGRTQYGLEYPAARDALLRGDFKGMSAIGLDEFTAGNTLSQANQFLGDYLEPSVGKPATTIMVYPLSMDIGTIGGKTFELEIPAKHRRLATEVGKLDDAGMIRTTGRAGALQIGPRVRLEAGQYEVDWIGRTFVVGKSKQQGTIDVVADSGKVVLASMPLRIQRETPSETWLGGLDFDLDEATLDVEFRLRVDSEVVLGLTRLRLRRVAGSNAPPRSNPNPGASASHPAKR
jgi:4-amino-4-deoxy-L-arabinose transferase-like glycosyltransferase